MSTWIWAILATWHIFTLLKHLMMLLKYNFVRASFLHITKDTGTIYVYDHAAQIFFKVKNC